MRQHLEHLLAAIAAVGIAVFISYFNTGAVVHIAPSNHASSALTPLPAEQNVSATTTIPAFSLSTSTLEALFPSQPKLHATSPVITATTTVHAPVVTPAPKPVPAPKPAATSTPATSTPSTDTEELAALSKSIVNIICIAHDGSLRSISGSGVIIDSRGIILTVAHVAQSSLLQQYLGTDKVSCTIRTGSPAKNAYIARPIYVSDAWVKENPTTLISSQPTGTGEHDYALLAITESASGSALPGAFPAISLAGATAHVGDAISIGSYGAQDLTSAQVRTGLYPTLATSTVQDRYTFGGNTVDVLAIAGSAASQEGSSGGAVVNTDGELIGIITTSKTSGPVSSREMRIITPDYIRRSYQVDTGKNFDTYFGNTSLTTLINVYAPTAVTLGQYIAQAIGFGL
jgi:S1-C subfamily serine protease